MPRPKGSKNKSLKVKRIKKEVCPPEVPVETPKSIEETEIEALTKLRDELLARGLKVEEVVCLLNKYK